MPDVTPAGPIAVALDGLRTLISNVAFFQAWTHTANATEALDSIFTGEVGFPITSIAIAGGVATVTTRDVHNLQDGTTITLEGASLGAESGVSVTGMYTISVANTTTFTFATALPDQVAQFPDGAFVLPCPRPIAVISEASDSVHSESIGTGGASIFGGTIEILLEADVSQQYQSDPRNAPYEARNAVGQFIQGLMTTQGTGDLMCLNKIEPAGGPDFTSRTEQDDNAVRFERWRALLRVTWGLDG